MKQTHMDSFFAQLADDSDNDSDNEDNESGQEASDNTSKSEAGTDDE